MKSLACALLVVAMMGCTGGSDHAVRPRTVPTTVGSTAPVKPVSPIRLEIVLGSRKLVVGKSVSAAVVVINRTGAPLRLQTGPGCKPSFALAVGNDAIPQHVAFASMCELGALIVPEGRTKYPLALSTSFMSCRPAGAQGTTPACLPGNEMPPLPAGRYRVSFEDNGTGLPAPEPVPVQVVAAPAVHN